MLLVEQYFTLCFNIQNRHYNVISKNVKILFTHVKAMYSVINLTMLGAAKYSPLGRMH